MKKLKPCPFCRNKPRYRKRKRYKTKHGVGCSDIDCIIWLPKDVKLRNLHHYVSVYVKYKDMEKAWNTRMMI